MDTLETVEVALGENPVGSIIWLHGLGADGHDFEAIVPELKLPAGVPLRFVFPHAPVRPVTVNGGMAMRAWFDIKSFDADGRADIDGVTASGSALEGLIERELARGVPASKIVIAGFSQGGAVAIHTMLRTSKDLAGVLLLSTYMALPGDVEFAASRKDLPIFMAHGTDDPVLPLAMGRASAERLIAAGYVVDWHEYPMAHAVCPQEIADISQWLSSIYC